MGQLTAILHKIKFNVTGYFHFASSQMEMAFFIDSKNLILKKVFVIFADKAIFYCPTNVPCFLVLEIFVKFFETNQILSQGIYNPTLYFFHGFDKLPPILNGGIL